MILADKIIMLRKRNGWSQEELAERLRISRQSVSKWESGASIPDLDKIIKMSSLFNVTTDYLLKEEMEELSSEEGVALGEAEETVGRMVTVEEAEEFLAVTRNFAKMVGLGVALCILSPICMILLAGLADEGQIPMTEEMAAGIGTVVLLLIVAVAVVIFILKGIHYSKYDFLEQDKIVLGYGVEGIIYKRKEAFRGTFAICIALGVALCILGIIPLFIVGGTEGGTVAELVGVAALLVLVAVATCLFVWSGIIYGCFDKLLQIGDYTNENKAFKRAMNPLAGVYWCLVTAVYLFWSFRDGRWGYTWIIWPVASVLYVAFMGIVKIIKIRTEEKKKNE